MASKYFKKALEDVKPENKRFVQKNLDITKQVLSILERNGMTQRDLAEKLGKSEPEVSRMLSGLHNLTLKTITRLEVALGEDIILTPIRSRESSEIEIPTAFGKVVSFKRKQQRNSLKDGSYNITGHISPEMATYSKETLMLKVVKSNVTIDRNIQAVS